MGSIVAVWIASFSMASGLLVWFAGGVALMFVGIFHMQFEDKLRLMAGWLVLGAACVLCFFVDSGPSAVPWPSGMHYVLSNPLTAVRHALTYPGASLAIPSMAIYAGIAVVLIAIPIIFLAERNLGIAGVASSLAIALYLGTALVPLLSGRLGLGVPQASSSRYCTAGALIPLGLYFCSLALAKTIRWGRYLVGAMILPIGLSNGLPGWQIII